MNSNTNAISLEVGKTGLIYNLTYDLKLSSSKFGFRIVTGSNLSKYLNAVTFGGGAYYLTGEANRFLELGIDLQYLIVDEVSDDQRGFTFVYPDYSIKTFFPSINVGFRTYGKRTMFRIGASPCLIKSKLIPGGYISFGIKF